MSDRKPLEEVLQVEAGPKSAPGDDEGAPTEGADDEGYADAGDSLKEALSSGDGLSIAKAVERLVELCSAKM